MRKNIDFGYTPSPYQEEVFDFVCHGEGNGVIKAVAGSGKSTTIVSAMQLVPKTKKCLFIAFNKSIVEELEERLKNNKNCKVMTIHSLGFRIVRANLGSDIVVDEYKYRTYVKKNICELTTLDCEELHLSERAINEYVDNITALIDFSRFNCAQTVNDISSVAETYGIPIPHDECEVVLSCLKWGKEHTDSVDYTDMVWLPYELSLHPMGNQYDWIFADEVQDFSNMAVELFFKCFKRGTRFIAVGDTDQSINMFAGSSLDAFERLCDYRNTRMFTLPVTYRCAKRIVDYVKPFSKDIMPRDGAPLGQILHECGIMDFKDGDMVLCRSKAPLATLYAKLLKMGVPCYMKGQEYGRELISLVESVDPSITSLGRGLMEDGLFPRLYDDMLNARNLMMEKLGLDMRDATVSSRIMYIYDEINTLIALSSFCLDRSDLVKRIDDMFNEDTNGVCLSTIHKAKGLEADNVYILCDSSMPSSLATKDWEKIQERNLQYVAYTRPKNVLGFVSEKIIHPVGSSVDSNSAMNDIRNIELCVCRLYGKQPMDDIGKTELTRFKVRHMKEMKETVSQVQNGASWGKSDNKLLSELLEMEDDAE